jgi:hypothetical protein
MRSLRVFAVMKRVCGLLVRIGAFSAGQRRLPIRY